MATIAGTVLSNTFVLVLTLNIGVNGAFPDFSGIQYTTESLRVKLPKSMSAATGFENQQKYFQEESSRLDFHALDGKVLLTDTVTNLGHLMSKKLTALERSVEWAEEVAQNYTWNKDLKLGDVEYIDTKTVNESDPAYEESALLKKKVNFDNSSVHIPVEIYEGEIKILNGLAWSAELDEQWKKNREEDPELLWQYFGGQNGIMRNYPASKYIGSTPDLYDVRRRPWYTQGASSPKDMLILIDTSGSTQGQALTLMKQAVKSLLETLGENDFVNVVHFSKEAAHVMPCFKTFVQATYWNKLILREHITNLKAANMANYKTAFEFSFQQILEFDRDVNKTEGTGANCNRIIMMLTDGGSDKPLEVFQKYNPDKRVRIFTYAVGPTANPIEAVRWIACNNNGYFDRIPAMGAIRSKVQEYVHMVAEPLATENIKYLHWSAVYLDAFYYLRFLSNCLAESQKQDPQWTHLYSDYQGLGMMTTVTLPVYNRTLHASNQTILGVMGSDITVKDMEEFIPIRKIGTNGYMFAINSNGYIVFHPELKATYGWLKDPANIDLLDIEYATPEKEQVRKAMIDGERGEMEITTYIYLPDEKHFTNKTRIYHYMPISNSSFSLGLVLPEYAQLYQNGRTQKIPLEEGIKTLEPDGETAVLLSSLKYCGQLNVTENETEIESLVFALRSGCNGSLVQELFSDANITQRIVDTWKQNYNPEENGFEAFFVSTNSGLTRVFPANASSTMEMEKDPWLSMYYKMAFDSEDWLYSVPRFTTVDTNSSAPLVMASRAMTISVSTQGNKEYKPGVVGGWVNQDYLRKLMFGIQTECTETSIFSCYFVDDNGFLILSNDDSESNLAGTFFGDETVEPILMHKLVNLSIYTQNIQYDYQAACPDKTDSVSAGTRIYIPTFFYDILSLSWWTSKFTWSILKFSFINWIFSPKEDYSAFAAVPKEVGNVSCVKEVVYYTLNSGESVEQKLPYTCGGNCTRKFATSRIKESNLLFVFAQKDCGGNCIEKKLSQAPKEVPDPNFSNGACNIIQRYRKRPACYDYDPNEDTSNCSGAVKVKTSICAMFTVVLVLLAANEQYLRWIFS